MIRVGFPLIGGGAWTGGLVYLKNTLRLVHARMSDELEPVVFLTQDQADRFGGELAAISGTRVVTSGARSRFGRGRSLARALVSGSDSVIEAMMREEQIDVAFEAATFYGWRFSIPTVAWMPDFQHRYMPEMFGRADWWRREIGFRTQVLTGRTIMLSSETARRDCELYYPSSKGRIRVVRFAIDLDVAPHFERATELRLRYELPDRFFYLPNQFWRHKNHEIVVEALRRIKNERGLAGVVPVVLSGLPNDPRNPAHFADLMAKVEAAGVGTHFRFLGLIPYADVLGLSAICDAVINPSKFEGWSTPIEEAKALGAPLILSNIDLHREQAPGASFFDPSSPEACAAALLEASASRAERAPARDLAAAQNVRLESHAKALRETLAAVLNAA